MVTIKKNPAENTRDVAVLYVKGVDPSNIIWMRSEAARLGYKASGYLNEVFDQLRLASKATRKAKKKK